MNDRNHPKVRPFTREIASALAIPPTFVNFVLAKKRPECFRGWVEDVDRGWTCYVPDEFDTALPLWSTNGDQTLLLMKDGAVSFGKGRHDEPDVESVARTAQGLLTHLMAELADSGESDEELQQAADFCGYPFLDDLLAVMDNAADANWDEVLEQFIAEVDARSV